MRRLHNFLVLYFTEVVDKNIWGENVHIVYSPYNVPGEGEHKIVHRIRDTQKITKETDFKFQ